MSNPISAEAKAVLAEAVTRTEKKYEVVAELLNADLRATVDVTDYVQERGFITGDSTLVSESWTKPGLTFMLRIDDSGYCLPGNASSLWAALDKSPEECWVIVTVYVPLKSGALEQIHKYIGKIMDSEEVDDGDVHGLELITVHASEDQLRGDVTKDSGDELTLLGSNW